MGVENMKTPLFIKNKVNRILKSRGMDYTFTRMTVDAYKQPTEGSRVTIRGLYHEQNSFISVAGSDSASVQRKKSPMILTLLDDSVKSLNQGDKITIESVNYTVSGVLDIQNYGVVADISLEMEV